MSDHDLPGRCSRAPPLAHSWYGPTVRNRLKNRALERSLKLLEDSNTEAAQLSVETDKLDEERRRLLARVQELKVWSSVQDAGLSVTEALDHKTATLIL